MWSLQLDIRRHWLGLASLLDSTRAYAAGCLLRQCRSIAQSRLEACSIGGPAFAAGHSQHELAKRQIANFFDMPAFRIDGGRRLSADFARALR